MMKRWLYHLRIGQALYFKFLNVVYFNLNRHGDIMSSLKNTLPRRLNCRLDILDLEFKIFITDIGF